jgi:hypothetical protein
MPMIACGRRLNKRRGRSGGGGDAFDTVNNGPGWALETPGAESRRMTGREVK